MFNKKQLLLITGDSYGNLNFWNLSKGKHECLINGQNKKIVHMGFIDKLQRLMFVIFESNMAIITKFREIKDLSLIYEKAVSVVY